MSARLKTLRQERGRHVESMRAILDKAKNENRELTAEETAEYDALEAKQDALREQVESAEASATKAKALEERDERTARLEADLAKTVTEPVRHEPGATTARAPRRGALHAAMTEYRKTGAFPAWFTGPTATQAYRDAYTEYLESGRPAAALQADSDVAGGYWVTPLQMAADLIKKLDDQVFVRQFATVRTVLNAQSLGIPTIESDPADADWTSEVATGNEDSTLSAGRRELHPHPLGKLIKVSNKLLRLDGAGAEAIVRDRLAYKFAIPQEKGFLTGTGAGQPLGVFTPSANGISTARDVATGSATDITADALFDAKYSIKGQYHGRLRWVLSREFVKRVRKLKDSTNQYLWVPGLSAGQQDRIVDAPFHMSEYVPNTFTTGKYVGVIGDFSFYWIADAVSIAIQRLVELYAATNQVGFIGRVECDGMPVLEEPFARLKTN